jgi:hypothetical protein
MAANDTQSMPSTPPVVRSVWLLVASVALIAAAAYAPGCDDSSKQQQQQNPAPNPGAASGSTSGDAEADQGPVSVVIALKPGATPGKPSVTVGGKPAGASLNTAVGNALKAMPAAAPGRSAAAPVKITADPQTPYADFQLALAAATAAGVRDVDVSLAGGETTRVTVPAAPAAGGGGRRLDLRIGRGTDGRGVAKIAGGAGGAGAGQTSDLRKGLKALLKKEKPSLGGDGAVTITSHALVPAGDVITVYRTCLELELPNVSFTPAGGGGQGEPAGE